MALAFVGFFVLALLAAEWRFLERLWNSRVGFRPPAREQRVAGVRPPASAIRDYAELENFPEIIRNPETIARYLDGQGWPE